MTVTDHVQNVTAKLNLSRVVLLLQTVQKPGMEISKLYIRYPWS